jgi:hypothetical protein
MYLDITTEFSCCCAVCFPNNNATAYIAQNPGLIGEVEDRNFAVEIWVKPTSINAFAPLWSWYKDNAYNAAEQFWTLDIYTSGGNHYPRLTVGYNGGGLRLDARGNTPIAINEWVHIVVNKIGTDRRKWEFFVNGVRTTGTLVSAAANGYYTNPGLTHTSHQFFYGKFTNGIESKYFSGCMAQARLYDRPLGMGEVKYNYQSGFYKPFSVEDLLTWSPFNACSGSASATIDGNIQSAFLSNFSGNPWSSDCPSFTFCNTGSNECRVNNPEDFLVFEACDQQTFPNLNEKKVSCEKADANIRPILQSQINVGYCTDCAAGSVVAEPIVTGGYIDSSNLVMGFSVAGITKAVSYMQIATYQCDTETVVQDSGIIEFPGDTITQHINEIITAAFANAGYEAFFENGTIYLNLGFCPCNEQHIFFTRRLTSSDSGPYELDPFLGVALEQYPDAFDCGISGCTSYTIINFYEMCVNREYDPVCVETTHYSLDLACDLSEYNLCELDGKRFCFGSKFAETPSFFTQPVRLGSQCDSILIRYRNENEGWITQRINATVDRAGYSKKQEISTSSKGITRKLLSVIDETFTITTDYYTKRWHDKMLRALESDYMEVQFEGEWISIVADDTYKINWEEIPMPQRGMGEIVVKKSKYKYLNTFC